MAKKDEIREQPVEITLEILRHNNRMKEYKYLRDTERLKHDNGMERHRIENAEKKKRDANQFERAKFLIDHEERSARRHKYPLGGNTMQRG